jgi:AcrR family transcriptional regulator
MCVIRVTDTLSSVDAQRSSMRVRDWQDILDDVTDASADPDGWRAIAGQRQNGVGEDLYLGHPGVGVYHLKTYAKNPYDVRGVGTKVARKIDDGIDPHLPTEALRRRFAVQSPPEDEDEADSMARRLEETVKVHAEAPTTPDDLFRDVMDAVDSPAYGPAAFELSDRPDALDALAETFDEAEELLSAELDDLIERDEVDRGFY